MFARGNWKSPELQTPMSGYSFLYLTMLRAAPEKLTSVTLNFRIMEHLQCLVSPEVNGHAILTMDLQIKNSEKFHQREPPKVSMFEVFRGENLSTRDKMTGPKYPLFIR